MARFQPNKHRKQHDQTDQLCKQVELPTQDMLAIYGRQSTKNQVLKNVQSGEMQTEDLMEFAKRLGWPEDLIILYIENRQKDGTIKSASGRLRIDQREGLKALVERIEADEIKAIVVFLEDRLFRDETMLGPDTFIDVCKRHGCIVITPNTTYNFHNCYHVKQFRDRCEQAADFLNDYIIARLHGGKNRISRKGLYDGRAMPMGYVVDLQEYIERDGTMVPNPGYKRYMIYEPHARVIRWIFRRFFELGGKLIALCRELNSMPVLFPDFDKEYERYAKKYLMQRVPGGYQISQHGLRSLLTNVAYIGWWMFHEEVISKTNHPAVIEEDLFWYAFEQLSHYTVEGERNEKKRRWQTRHTEETPGILKNVIFAEDEGDSVYVTFEHQEWIYSFYRKGPGSITERGTSILVSSLDHIFVERFLQHLERTERYKDYHKEAKHLQEAFVQAKATVQTQLDIINARIEGLEATLELPPSNLSKEKREKFAAKLEKAEARRAELLEELKEPRINQGIRVLLKYQELIKEFGTDTWDMLLMSDKRLLVEALTEHVTLLLLAPRWIGLHIIWKDKERGSDLAYIYRTKGATPEWAEEEHQTLVDLYPSAPQTAILEQLPKRSWRSIVTRASKMNILRIGHIRKDSLIPEALSLEDWQFMQEHNISYESVAPPKYEDWKQAKTLASKWSCALWIDNGEVSTLEGDTSCS